MKDDLKSFLAADLAADRHHPEVVINDDGSRDDVRTHDIHQYAPEYNPTCAYRVDKNYGEKK